MTHAVIPILGVSSFLMNDSPIGKLRPIELWHGTAYVSYYGVNILILISLNVLPSPLIPYFFLDYRQSGWGSFFGAFAFIYVCAYLMTWGLSIWNRKLSWLWFKDVARTK